MLSKIFFLPFGTAWDFLDVSVKVGWPEILVVGCPGKFLLLWLWGWLNLGVLGSWVVWNLAFLFLWGFWEVIGSSGGLGVLVASNSLTGGWGWPLVWLAVALHVPG